MSPRALRLPAEVTLTAGFLGLALLLSLALDLPFALPDGRSAAFVGIHYLYPLAGIAIWAAIVILARRQPLGMTFLIALPCYALVLIVHFNLKLWIPHVNPALWDEQYWAVDRMAYPLVAAAKSLRLTLAPAIPLGSNFYMLGFIALFYISFAHHALHTPREFRALVLATLIMQTAGSLAYFATPALGPFIYDAGVEPPAAAAQAHMLEVWRASSAGGASWLRANAASELTGGLAAMPSLHAGGSLLFVLFAWRYARRLLWLFVPLFAFITTDALANRWHYVVDIPAGWAIAAFAFAAAHYLVRHTRDAQIAVRGRDPAPQVLGRPAAPAKGGTSSGI